VQSKRVVNYVSGEVVLNGEKTDKVGIKPLYCS